MNTRRMVPMIRRERAVTVGTLWSKWYRPAMVGLSALILGVGAALFHAAATGAFGQFWGVGIKAGNIKRWLDSTGYLNDGYGAAPYYTCPTVVPRPRIITFIN